MQFSVITLKPYKELSLKIMHDKNSSIGGAKIVCLVRCC